MAKKKTKKTGRRGGGRTPGAWTLLTQDTLKTFRKDRKLSRSRLAELLGVSSGSVMNWETGRSVPLTRTQEQIVALMQGGAPAAAPARKRGSNGAARLNGAARSNGAAHVVSASGEAALLAVGDILKGYLATPKGGEVTQEQLVGLAVSLRAALS